MILTIIPIVSRSKSSFWSACVYVKIICQNCYFELFLQKLTIMARIRWCRRPDCQCGLHKNNVLVF